MEPRPALRAKLEPLDRDIVTPTVARHRVFAWLHRAILPDHQLIVIARDDDVTFGILHSRFHEAWSLRLGTWLGVGNDPRYTPTTTFETYPFPEGLTPNRPTIEHAAEEHAADPRALAIAEAARRLTDARNNWLNPRDLTITEPEVASGYPDRVLPKDTRAAAILRERTLTKLYNDSPQWLANAHRELVNWMPQWQPPTAGIRIFRKRTRSASCLISILLDPERQQYLRAQPTSLDHLNSKESARLKEYKPAIP